MSEYNFKENLTGMSVVIINDFGMSSSIGIQMKDYNDAISGYGKLISLAYSWKPDQIGYPGTLFLSDFREKHSSVAKSLSLFPDLGIFINSRFSNIAFRELYRAIRTNRGDAIIHYSNNRVTPFITDDRSVVTMNDLIYVKSTRFKEVPIKTYLIRNTKIYKKFRNVISVSNATKEELIDFGFEGRIETIYQPVSRYFRILNKPKVEIRKKLGLPLDKYLLLSVSTNRPGKNLRAAKETLDLLGIGFALVRIGVPVGKSITFSHVDDETLNEIYNACDILLFPSTEEGFGRPVIEAFKVGLPVVASDIEVMREICGDSAICVSPTPLNLKNGVLEILENRDEFIRKGLLRSNMFSHDIFTEKLKNYYAKI